MTVISVKNAGHVVGALTSRGLTAGPAAPGDVVGEAIEIRDPLTGIVQLSVPADQLELASVDVDANVLVEPRRFVMLNGVPTLEPNPLNAADEVTLSAAEIRATFPAAAANTRRKVWVQVEGGPQDRRYVNFKEVDAPAASVSFPQILAPGSYRWMLLVDDFLAKIGTDSV
jgi:hypothetical protein